MPPEPTPLPRRTFIAGALAATAAACSSGASNRTASTAQTTPQSTPQSTSESTGASAPSETAASSSSSTAATRFVSTGPRDRPQVALTFHVSGDRSLVVRLLDLLKAESVPITAFVVGSWLDAHRDLAARFAADGHEIANHTYTHLTFPKLSRGEMESEVGRCRDVLQAATGHAGDFFRPSGTSDGTSDPGTVVRDVAYAAGYATIAGFDVDPSDYADPGARAVADRTIAAVQPGSIVSLHFGHSGTIDALPRVISALSTRSLRPVTLSALLA